MTVELEKILGEPVKLVQEERLYSFVASKYVGRFKIYKFPYCAGIAIMANVEVNPEYRGKGIGRELNNIAANIARADNYTLLICTDVETNEPQRKILKKLGWKDIYQFTNKNTKNLVNITIKEL